MSNDRRPEAAAVAANPPRGSKAARGRTTSQHALAGSARSTIPTWPAPSARAIRSRAAYKLQEIDEREKLLKPGDRVVDLGAAPGGWCQIAVAKIGAPARGKIVAIDILEMAAIPGVDFVQIDFLDPKAPDLLKEMLGGPADVVLSDMAANTTGHRQTDNLRTLGLVEAAAEFAREVLAPGGRFLSKVLQGGTEGELLNQLKRDYQSCKAREAARSRQGSSELYVLATGFRASPRADDDPGLGATATFTALQELLPDPKQGSDLQKSHDHRSSPFEDQPKPRRVVPGLTRTLDITNEKTRCKQRVFNRQAASYHGGGGGPPKLRKGRPNTAGLTGSSEAPVRSRSIKVCVPRFQFQTCEDADIAEFAIEIVDFAVAEVDVHEGTEGRIVEAVLSTAADRKRVDAEIVLEIERVEAALQAELEVIGREEATLAGDEEPINVSDP